MKSDEGFGALKVTQEDNDDEEEEEEDDDKESLVKMPCVLFSKKNFSSPRGTCQIS